MGERFWFGFGWLVGRLLRVWRWTIRLEVRNRLVVPPPPYVLAVWHGRIIGGLMDNYDSRGVSMASLSNDGALAAGILAGVGLGAARGSTSRGGREALTVMEEMIRAGAPFGALTVDGPRGPWRDVKPGVVLLARRLGVPIVPITFACDRPKLLRSWDRGVIPKPFSRVVTAYGEPWSVDRLGGDLAEVCDGIAGSLEDLTAALDREVTGREVWPPR